MNSGIYMLRNKINNRVYIGSCDDFNGRYIKHKSDALDRRQNKILQADIDMYGFDNFAFEILEKIDKKNFNTLNEFDNYMIEKENYYMDYYNSYNPKCETNKGYNMRRASRIGENGRKNKRKLIGVKSNKYNKKESEKTRKRKSESKKGEKNINNKVNLEICLKIKKLIIEKTDENWSKKRKRISKETGIGCRTIDRIRAGDHYMSEKLGGSYWDWTGETKRVMRNYTLDDAILVKEKLLIENNMKKIQRETGFSRNFIESIKNGNHAFSKKLNGGLKDWLKKGDSNEL